ncbi:MAG: hypothetical protein ACK4YT_00710 [Sphingomonas sp.]
MAIENDDVAAQLVDFLARQDAFTAMLAAWSNGAIDGGPNGDGRYPLPNGLGTTTLVPSPARSAFDASLLRFERIQLPSGNTIVLGPEHSGKALLLAGTTGTSNINVTLPGNVPIGWACTLIQQGSGGPRVTVGIGNNGSGEPGFLRSRGSVFRLADQYAVASAICIERTASFRSTIVLAGDIVQ